MELGVPSTLDVQPVQERTVLDDPINHSVLQIIACLLQHSVTGSKARAKGGRQATLTH